MISLPFSHPILGCAEARAMEEGLFQGRESAEWDAMQRAGQAIARAVLCDFQEVSAFPRAARLLLLVGKGHNGADALIAAQTIVATFPAARAEVLFVFGESALRPLARRAWREIQQGKSRAGFAQISHLESTTVAYDLCLDGVFGFQFRAPAEERVATLLARVNSLPIRLRAAVDLPSAGLFRADFTYATGSVKLPVVGAAPAGRVRYLDLGFFSGEEPGAERVLTTATLAPLNRLRPAASDKRTYGHVFIVGGSRSFPGAVLMTALAALRSGAGLVTVFVPETVAPAFAARAPEAMWVGCPETPEGGLALEGHHLIRSRLDRATALVIGPGLGREAETLALAREVVSTATVPLVIDADALQADIVSAGKAPRILTPHAGEFGRIKGGADGDARSLDENRVTVLKGPVTRVLTPSTAYHSFFGGPVLARGGSGDLLAGLIGGLLAQIVAEGSSQLSVEDTRRAAVLAATRGVVWHGIAADLLARAHGQTAVSVTQLLDFLPGALRESAHE